jgi:predicted DNA-binding transcriptional regulator AlpA
MALMQKKEARGMERELFDSQSVAYLLDITMRTLKRWVEKGKFPPPDFRDGETIRWSRKLIFDWIEARKQVA